jgi:hypothetical protein
MTIQANWFNQPQLKLGKQVRQHLLDLGVYKIIINPYESFSSAKVRTCSVFCKRGYRGTIELTDLTHSRTIEDFSDTILYSTNPQTLTILNKLKPADPWTTCSGKYHADQWRIVTSYRKENFDIQPLNPLKIIPPNYKSQSGYRIFACFTTEQEAQQQLSWYQSFWQSELISWILIKTRTSTTLDNPQILWVPRITIDQEFNNLFSTFNLGETEVDHIRHN